MHQTNTIINLRNSRTAVKRAKLEHKDNLTNHTYSIEKQGVKHQIVNADKVRMNAVFKELK